MKAHASTPRYSLRGAFALLGIILLTAILSIASYDFFMGESSTPEGVVQITVTSAILGQDRELIIHLPRNYDSTKHYPVAYVLDGSSLDNPVANAFDVLSTAGYVPEAIIVGIPNMSARNRQYNLVPPYLRVDNDKPDSPMGEGDKFLSFMDSELFPFIEKNYPTAPNRLFIGHSRGGLLVMYSLVFKPGMFQARLCFSTPMWRQDHVMISKTSEFLGTQDSLHTFVYMSVGEMETENMKSGFVRMSGVFMEHALYGFKWVGDTTKIANHQTNAQVSTARGIARWGKYMKSVN